MCGVCISVAGTVQDQVPAWMATGTTISGADMQAKDEYLGRGVGKQGQVVAVVCMHGEWQGHNRMSEFRDQCQGLH